MAAFLVKNSRSFPQGKKIEVACPYNCTDMMMQCNGGLKDAGPELWTTLHSEISLSPTQMELTETLDRWVLDPQRMASVLSSFSLSMFADSSAFKFLQQLSNFGPATSAAAWLGWKM